MIPWNRLDAVRLEDGVELKLMQRGSEFSIMLGVNELMNSRLSGSEEALASLAAEKLQARQAPRLLIGGLGMGFTLRAALDILPADARITVAELVPAVVEWARGPMAEVFGTCLADPRVAIRLGDVGTALVGEKLYDAILLDVDNGPEGLTRDSNQQLYSVKSLRRTMSTLRPGGVLAVWSSHTSAPFTKRLLTAGYLVKEEKVRARGKKGGERHHIWLATKPAATA